MKSVMLLSLLANRYWARSIFNRVSLSMTLGTASSKPLVVIGKFPTIEETIGQTPLVRLQRLADNDNNNIVLCKLEGNNPAGSVKDRPALSMIKNAEMRGLIKPGDTLIEATSGNTGIALALVCAIRGYKLKLIMPNNMSEERKASMRAYGAELIVVPPGSMEKARDLAKLLEDSGEGRVLDQFGNQDNPLAHIGGTGPELWEQTNHKITHFVSSMGTTGTIMGTSKFLKEKNKNIEIIGLQPTDGSSIPGIRKWPKEYLPKIFDSSRVDKIVDQTTAEVTMRKMAEKEGIFAGVSSGAAVHAAIQIAQDPSVRNAVIVSIVCDRGDRYLSTGVYKSDSLSKIPAKTENLFDVLKTIEGLKDTYVIYYSDWCPDCRAVPGIVSALQNEASRTGRPVNVVMCNVGDRDLWKSGSHPLKTGAPGLKGIPTLMKWGVRGSEESRLERGLYDGSALASGGIEAVKQIVQTYIGIAPQ